MNKITLSRGQEYENFPKEVFIEGDDKLLAFKLACIVGSREMSREGERKAREVTTKLGKAGFVIMSGLALGVDKTVHEVALEHDFPTIAVVPTSLDRIYPRENIDLARQIVKKGGLLVSEHDSGTSTMKWHFLSRNRLMVGLCDFLVVVEAQEKSGSTYSASCAAELGKDIFVFPGSPGCDLLLEEGANLVTDLYVRLALEE